MIAVLGGLVFDDDRGGNLVRENVPQELTHFVLLELTYVDALVLDHRRLRPVVLEVVLGAVRPAVDAGFMFPLVILMSHRKCVLIPYQHLSHLAECCI